MWVDHVLLRDTGVKLAVGFHGVLEGDDLHVGGCGKVDFVEEDGVHQLFVVTDDRALSGVEAERFGPAEADPGGDVAFLGSIGRCTRVAGDVEPWDADRAGGLGDLHHVVEHLRWLLDLVGSATAASRFKADAVDARVHLWCAEDVEDLVWDWNVFGDVNDLAPNGSRVGETLGVVVPDDDARGTEELARGGRGEADWAGASNVDGGAWANVGLDGAVEAGWEDVRQGGQAGNLFHGLVFVRELQQVEVGIRHHDILGLSADPATHIDVTVGGARTSWVDVEADASVSSLAEGAPTACNVERHGAEVALLDELDVGAAFNHFAGDFVTEDLGREKGRGRGSNVRQKDTHGIGYQQRAEELQTTRAG